MTSPVEMGHLFDQPQILQQRRAALAGGENVQVVGNRGTGRVRQMLGFFLLGHCHAPSS
jgi:hypothetical protein